MLRDSAYIKTEEYCHSLDGNIIDNGYSPFSIFIEQLQSGDNPPYLERIIPTENIIKWAKEYDIKLWFDVNPLDVIQKDTVDISQIAQKADIPQDLLEIQRLLNGEHNFQAPELVTTLKVWLAAINDPYATQHNAKRRIESHIPSDITAEAARERIAKVCNWNKNGNR